MHRIRLRKPWTREVQPTGDDANTATRLCFLRSFNQPTGLLPTQSVQLALIPREPGADWCPPLAELNQQGLGVHWAPHSAVATAEVAHLLLPSNRLCLCFQAEWDETRELPELVELIEVELRIAD